MYSRTLTAALAAAIALVAPLAKATELKLADFQPPGHPIVANVYDPMGKAISDGTDGKVTLKVYMGGELGAGPVEQYNRVVDGVADIAFSLPGYTASNFPKTLLTELPGAITPEHGAEQINANLDLLKGEYRRVVLLSLWNNAPNLLMTSKKAVRSMADLKGLKIRVPSRNAGLVVQAWGGTPVSMPAPDIYNAMQTGVLDGAMIDATSLKTFKLAEVTNYITEGMKPTISEFFLIMNRDSFAGLSDEQQKVVMEAGHKAALDGARTWADVAAKALADFKATDGKEVIELDADAAKAFDNASATAVQSAVKEAEDRGIDAKGYLDALSSTK